MWRRIRIAVLLLILLAVALGTWTDHIYSTNWDNSLRVALFPINGDHSEAAARHIAELEREDFRDIELFFTEQARRYGLRLEQPIQIKLGEAIREHPPMIQPGASALGVMAWSLRARYWAWRIPKRPPGGAPDIQLFLLFYDPVRHSVLPHSIGIKKGLFGIVHVFADRRALANHVVITHELLHTLGATDKYDSSNQPLYPQGYAEPERVPRLPQRYAEIMGGRIPRTEATAEIPPSLRQVVIGPITAEEINWR